MGYKFNLESFLKKSPEEQAKIIERETQKVISKLPSLKKNLKMYGETTSELYNLPADQIELEGVTYARAVRSGEISTPSGKKAYHRFVSSLSRFANTNIHELAQQTAQERLDTWLEHIKANGSEEDYQYAVELLNSMTDQEKLTFTLSEYFLDTSNFSSEGYVLGEEEGNQYSVQTLKLELFLKTYQDGRTRNIYNTEFAKDGEDKMRGAYRGHKPSRAIRKKKK